MTPFFFFVNYVEKNCKINGKAKIIWCLLKFHMVLVGGILINCLHLKHPTFTIDQSVWLSIHSIYFALAMNNFYIRKIIFFSGVWWSCRWTLVHGKRFVFRLVSCNFRHWRSLRFHMKRWGSTSKVQRVGGVMLVAFYSCLIGMPNLGKSYSRTSLNYQVQHEHWC